MYAAAARSLMVSGLVLLSFVLISPLGPPSQAATPDPSACPPNPSPPNPADHAVIVDTPTAGQRVISPVLISGRANVFEAVVSITIFDANGQAIVNTTTMTSESFVLSPFSTRVLFTVAKEQLGCIRVFESSPKDGSPVNVVQRAVILSPGPGLEIRKDSKVRDDLREYRIAARIAQGELSVTDEVTVIDNIHVDMSFQGIREVGAGWTCRLHLIPESEGAFLRCVLKDRTALNEAFETVVRYDACDNQPAGIDSGLVENFATIFLNGKEKASGSANADLPECKAPKPAATPTSATSTPVVISPPSTGSGGLSGRDSVGSPVALLGTITMLSGIALLVWSRKVVKDR